MSRPEFLLHEPASSVHRDADDLLSAGLGMAGLCAAQAPVPLDPENPTAAELRRRAIYNNWHGIADLSAAGGFGTLYGALPALPGREYQAFARVGVAQHPHRVLAQVPDAFDHGARCLLVAPASGSRGIYGAIALAGGFGLPRGCAVVYTDKGAGSGYFDLDNDEGVGLDGRRAGRDTTLDFAASLSDAAAAHSVAIKHAHSQDNPEADWGQHVLQAAQFGLYALGCAFPHAAPFTARNTRIIAVGLSNGGAAVLRAAEQDLDGRLAALVAIAPNISAPGARPLFDYATEAALYQPCLLDAWPQAPQMLAPELARDLAAQRCASLRAVGMLESADRAAQVEEARQRLRASGWSDAALRLANVNAAIDLWRAVVASYAQAYARSAVTAPVCGYAFAALDAAGQPRASSRAERALWWSDGAGVAPGAGLGIVDTLAVAPDRTFAALRCARGLWTDPGAGSVQVRANIDASRASARLRAPFALVVHGSDDGLIPCAFTSEPYVRAARAQGAKIAYWQVPHAQHFDALLAHPAMASQYLPLLPYAYFALAHTYAHVIEGAVVPGDRVFANHPRADQILSAKHLAIAAIN